MGVCDSDLCPFCNTTKDSIQHMFWQCNHVQLFWQALINIVGLNERCTHAINMQISESLALFGIDKDMEIDSTFYFIILLAKQSIYHCKLNNIMPVLHVFLQKVKKRYMIEEYIAKSSLKYNDFMTKWIQYKPIFY